MNKSILRAALCAALLAAASTVYAEELKVDVSQSNAVESALKVLVGKSVTVSTGDGGSITGVVEAVGPDSVKLKELSGKEFFSAVVKLASIDSVTFRAK